MSYLEQAKNLKEDYDWLIKFKGKKQMNCFDALLDSAKSLRNTIIGVSMLKNYKTKNAEDAIRILDAILGESAK